MISNIVTFKPDRTTARNRVNGNLIKGAFGFELSKEQLHCLLVHLSDLIPGGKIGVSHKIIRVETRSIFLVCPV